MALRFLLATIVSASALVGAADAAYANPKAFWGTDDRFSGGRPPGQLASLGMFGGGGGSGPVARSTVAFAGNHAPGTIIINTKERRLYYVLGEGRALRYGIGVGREGFQWAGTQRISMKKEWPSWTPPAAMLRRRPDLPRFMKGGPENPLGARAMYLGSSIYRIHGSNEPETIGTAVSSGCIRLTNEDVIDLYQRTKVGAKVIVLRH